MLFEELEILPASAPASFASHDIAGLIDQQIFVTVAAAVGTGGVRRTAEGEMSLSRTRGSDLPGSFIGIALGQSACGLHRDLISRTSVQVKP